MSAVDDAKAQVALSCRIIGRLGLTRETNGHVSMRLPDGAGIAIKGRGPDEAALSFTQPEDVMVVDMDGKLIEGRAGLAVAQEVYIHTRVMKARPEVNSVIHIHPANVVAFTIAQAGLLPIIGAYNPQALRLITDGLPLYPRSILINSNERGDDLARVMGSARACLMRGHGITTAGASVEEATLTAIHLDDLAELQYKATVLGTPEPISDEDIADFAGMLGGGRGGGAPRGPSAEWRYYERLYGT